ncbi:MAG TPA: hypothetical protein VMI33_24510 [Streptosporangiaceae bacterium]|nr:hypothetical protein [Streptosporangiaceae bacterium]
MSDPPLCGVVDDAEGALLVPDDPQPARTTATAAAAMIGADRMNLRL